jgi:hypothetical protein
MNDARAKTHVLGSVLMVGLVLFTSIAVFVSVTGFWNPFAPPQVGFGTTQFGGVDRNESSTTVTFTHETGDAVPVEDLVVRVDGDPVSIRPNLGVSMPADPVETGDAIVVEQSSDNGLTGGERITLVYLGDEESTVLAVHEVREA